MSGPMFNALCLAGGALLVTSLFHRRLRSRQASEEPFFPNETAQREFLRARYAAKARFRAGVFLCSLAALLVYLGGGGRIVPLLLLCGAALCQLGAVRQKTAGQLTRVMQRRFFVMEEPDAAAPADAASDWIQENEPTHATTRR